MNNYNIKNNKNKIDWSIPRQNINYKTNEPYKRGRSWTIIVYPDSLPKNWLELLQNEPVAISPLHDKDVNPDGTLKKPHYHIVLNYKGNKSFEQIDELSRALRGVVPEKVNNITGVTRYLTHMDNPEKYQYKSSDILTFGGFDLENILKLSVGNKREILKDIIMFINDNNIFHLSDLTIYCLSDDCPAGWFEVLTERNTLFIKEYIKSLWQKKQNLINKD